MKRNIILVLGLSLFFIFLFFVANRQPAQLPLSNNARPTAIVTIPKTSKCQARQVNSQDLEAFLPDPTCTPGRIDIRVTQENIHSTICVTGYTLTVRPPVAYTNKLKQEQILDYGFTDTNPKIYEEDHLISLELGGDPQDPANLWPEPGSSPNEKDKVENYLHREVCAGRMTLDQAQTAITQNWYQLYQQLNLN